MSEKPFDAEYAARVLERIAENDDVQKRIAPKTTGVVTKDALKGLLAMRSEDAEERVRSVLGATKFGRFTMAVRELFGLRPISTKMLSAQRERDLQQSRDYYLQEEAEAERILQARIKEAEDRERFNAPKLPREFPDAETLKQQPVIALPDADSDPTRTTKEKVPVLSLTDDWAKETPRIVSSIQKDGTTKPIAKSPPPPPAPKIPDSKVNKSVVQGILFFEVPLPVEVEKGYTRESLEFVGDYACTLVEKGVVLVYYYYGTAPYEGNGSLLAVFHDGSVDAISLGHCSCNGPLDDLSSLKRGAFFSVPNFREALSAEAKSTDYSTILACLDGKYPDPYEGDPGAQETQQFPTTEDVLPSGRARKRNGESVRGKWSHKSGVETRPNGSFVWNFEYKETPVRKKRAKKSKSRKTATKKSAKKRKK